MEGTHEESARSEPGRLVVRRRRHRGRGAGHGPGRARDRYRPPGYGTLTQNDVSLRIRTPDIDMRFIPLDARVTRCWRGTPGNPSDPSSSHGAQPSTPLRGRRGISHPGLALVTFFSQRANARFDPQTLTLVTRNRVFQPLGIVPFTRRFTAQQLDVREQVSAIYLFEEDLPVNDSFTITYAGLPSEDWQNKQPVLDRERARVRSASADRRARHHPRPTALDKGTERP